MELLDGEDVERIIANNRPLSVLKKLDIIMQAASGLHHAHSKGIVHRDVKPANIMVLASGTVKIMDFGIALVTQATADRITPQGSMIGTLPYMAPEQFFGSGSSVMTDIFAFGVTCYKLLTGTHPFHAAELGSMMHNIANLQPPSLRSLNAQCPEALEHVVDRLLAKKPEDRYQSLEDAQFDLEPVIHDLRNESLGQLLEETREKIAADDLDTAQSIVRQAFEIDPVNRTARELRETIQKLVKDRTVRPRVTALTSEGRDQLASRRFDEAIKKFESALSLDKSNTELRALIEQARAAMDRARRADRLVEEAEQALRVDDLTAAHNNIADALAADPKHARAGKLAGEVRQRVETRRRERVQGGIAHVKDLLQRRRFAEAAKRIAQLQEAYPEAAELADLASYAARELKAETQAQSVARVMDDVRALAAAGQFDEALHRLEKAVAEHPDVVALRDLVRAIALQKVEQQRRDAVRKLASDVQKLLDEGRFGPAAQILERAGAQFPGETELVKLLGIAQENLREQQRVEAISRIVVEAEGMVRARRFDEGLKAINEGQRRYGPEDRLMRWREAIVAAQLADREQGLARVRSEGIAGALKAADLCIRKREFDQAVVLINEALRRYGADDALVQAKHAAIAAKLALVVEASERTIEVAKNSASPRMWLAAGLGIAVLIAGAAFFLRSPQTAPSPVVAPPVEIHSQASERPAPNGNPGLKPRATPPKRDEKHAPGETPVASNRVADPPVSIDHKNSGAVVDATPHQAPRGPEEVLPPAQTVIPDTGQRAREAMSRIADLAWAGVDQSNIEAVRKFARENADNPHRAEAQRIVDQYDAAQERTRQEQQARKREVRDTLSQLNSALQRKRPAEVKALWPGASAVFIDSVKSSQVEMSLTAREEDIELAPGSGRAIARCDLVTHVKGAGSGSRRQRATVTLRVTGNAWTIELLKIE
jgi:tetratricopeptide (TPR) repeat protein